MSAGRKQWARFVSGRRLYNTPTALHADAHRRLADFFGVDSRALDVRELWKKAA